MNTPGTIRIVLVEDQTLVLGALAALIDLESDLQVIGRAANGSDAKSLITRERPDVVMSDIEMPGISGLELAQWIAKEDLPCQTIILTTFDRPGYVRRALDIGVRGFLLKDSPAEKLADAIRTVHRGGRCVDPELALRAWDEKDPLSDRERQVLRLAGQGHTSSEIAQSLHLTPGTIRNYLSEAIGKLGASNRVEAARLARQKGWL